MRGHAGRHHAIPLLVAVAALIAAADADAGSGGVTLVRAESKELPAGKTATTTAKCPEDASVTGGGVFIKNGNTATAIHSSYPIDDGDDDIRVDDGWRGRANSRSAGDKRTRAIAICSRAGKFRYLQAGIEVEPGQDGVAKICDTGEPVAGGGAFLAGKHTASGLAATEPYDNDADTVPDDGWSAAANNTSGGDLLLRVFVICARSGGSYQYVSDAGSAPPSSQGFATATCPVGTILTGGGGTTGTSTTTAELANAVPGITMGSRMALDVNNLSGVPLDFSASAVCRG